MGRMKAFYFDNLNDDDNPLNELIDSYIGDVKLPSEKELKKISKVVKKQDIEEYAELTGEN